MLRQHVFTVRNGLILCLVLAAALRIWGLDYGLPHPTTRPDEERIVGRAYSILAKGDFNPVTYTYPGLMIYLNTLALAAYSWIGRLLGYYDSLFDFQFAAVVTQPGLHYRISRAVSVVLGVGTVGITYALARVGYQSRTVGLVAALALATNYLHVRDSHFATVDTGMTFFVTMALFYAVKASRDPSVKHYALAGLFAGAATAAKYNAGLVISGLAALTIHRLVANDPDQANTTRSGVIGRFVLAGVMMLIAFAVFSPYSLIHYRAALKELAGVHRFLSDAPGEYGLWVHLRTTFPTGFGWPLYLASIAGIVRAAWLRRPIDVILLAFVLSFFVHVAGLRAVYPRYIVPLVPALAVLAAELVVRGLARGRKPIVVAATIALVMPGLWRSAQFDRLAARKDTRILAAEWVSENLPRRSEILVCEGYGAPVINKDRRRPPWFEPHQVSCRRKAPRRGESNYLITHEHPVIWSSPPIPADLERLLEERGTVLARFDPFSTESTNRAYYYGHDGFYLPFSGLDTVERGGPKITIWNLGTDGEAIP